MKSKKQGAVVLEFTPMGDANFHALVCRRTNGEWTEFKSFSGDDLVEVKRTIGSTRFTLHMRGKGIEKRTGDGARRIINLGEEVNTKFLTHVYQGATDNSVAICRRETLDFVLKELNALGLYPAGISLNEDIYCAGSQIDISLLAFHIATQTIQAERGNINSSLSRQQRLFDQIRRFAAGMLPALFMALPIFIAMTLFAVNSIPKVPPYPSVQRQSNGNSALTPHSGMNSRNQQHKVTSAIISIGNRSRGTHLAMIDFNPADQGQLRRGRYSPAFKGYLVEGQGNLGEILATGRTLGDYFEKHTIRFEKLDSGKEAGISFRLRMQEK